MGLLNYLPLNKCEKCDKDLVYMDKKYYCLRCFKNVFGNKKIE